MEKVLFENRVVFLMNYRPDKLLSEQTGQGLTSFRDSEEAERIAAEMKRQRELKSSFDENFETYRIPSNKYGANQIVLPKGSEVEFFQKGEQRIPLFNFVKWLENPAWAPYTPSEKDLQYIFPDNTLKRFILPDGRKFTATVKRKSDKPLVWIFNWYTDTEGQPYDQSEFVDIKSIPDDYLQKEGGFWDKWGWVIMAGLSVAAVMIFPGAPGLYLSLGIDMVPALESLKEGNLLGTTIGIILALIPFAVAKIPGLGTITKQDAEFLAKKFSVAKNESEISTIYQNLSDPYKIKFQTVFNQDPTKLLKSLDDAMWDNLSKGLYSGIYDSKQIINLINDKIREGLIKYPDVVKWYQKSGWKRFGIELGATGLVIGSVLGYGKYKEREFENLYKTRDDSPYTEEETEEFLKAISGSTQ